VAQAESTSRRADQKALYVHRSSASAQDAGSWQHRIKARSELSAGATLDCQGLRCRRQHDRRRGRVPDCHDCHADLSCMREELIMRRIALVIFFLSGLTAPAFAQKSEIDAVNAKWVEFFNNGDFAGIASLYTEDATAFPPGSGMVKGRPAIGTMWKNMAENVTDPQLTTLDVKPLGPSAAREIGTFSLKTKGPAPQEVTGKYVVVWEKVGGDWKLRADIWNEGK
jgi:uncharacterized protein (TIGR02246 family)